MVDMRYIEAYKNTFQGKLNVHEVNVPEVNATSNEHIRTYRPADMLIKKLANNHIANPPPKLPSANRRLSTPSSSPFAPEISRTRSPRLSPRALEIETIYEITFTLG